MEPSLLQFYISRQWLNKFKTFAEPGPISNNDFLCIHGGVPPRKAGYIEDLVLMLPQNIWDNLYSRFVFFNQYYHTSLASQTVFLDAFSAPFQTC